MLIDGQAEKSCDKDIQEVAGRSVTTIEGLSANRSHPLQKAWIANQVPQCGYCQSGMLMACAGQLQQNPGARAADVVSELENVCVCGTYQRIKTAVATVTNG